MKKMLIKWINKTVVVVAIICVAVTTLFFFPMYTYPYWSEILGKSRMSDFIVKIGRWQTDEPGTINFDEVYNNIINADSLLSRDGSTGYTAHILGVFGVDTPEVPLSLNVYDVLIWQEDSAVVAYQIVADYPEGAFDSWLSLGGYTKDHSAFNNGSTIYNTDNLYTLAHAPISYNGQLWLARHNQVFSSPQIGNDWFLVSDSWVNQLYPKASFIEHNGRHFISLNQTTNEPGTNEDWLEIESFSDQIVDYIYTQGSIYRKDDIVKYEGSYYISLINNNTSIPTQSANWQVFMPYDSTDTVPIYNSQTDYNVGDFVRYEESHYLKTGNYAGTPTSGNGAFTLVNNYKKYTGVPEWKDDMVYNHNYVNVFVEDEGLIFQHISSWSQIGVRPINDTNNWRRILSWEETQRAKEYSAEDYELKRIFTYQNDFYGVVIKPWRGMEFNESYFRKIERWNSQTTYRVLTQNDPYNNPPADHRYFAYTLNGEELEFWTLRGEQGFTLEGAEYAPHDDSPYWEKIVFECKENVVCTTIGGEWVIWDRVIPYTEGEIISAPSELNKNEWIRRNSACDMEYVYTDQDNITLLWRKTVAGETYYTPGDRDWELVSYKTGKPYLYTYNPISGNPMFWYSHEELFTRPSLDSSGWTLLMEESWQIEQTPMYVYTENSGIIRYFATRFNPEHRGEFEFANAWIGYEGEQMSYFWQEHNIYNNGELVVLGTSLTNTYGYFRLKEGVDPVDAVDCRPGTQLGSVYWEAVCVLDLQS